ncbi:hypothetical protein BH23PLA1_BH23PLA1_37330 [soil metagenome]
MSHTQRPDRKVEQRDYGLTSLALVMSLVGLSAGWGGAWLGLAIAALPVGGFIVLGHVPDRGAALASVYLTMGSVLIPTAIPGAISWMSLAVLVGIASAALLGGALADQLTEESVVAVNNGRWVNVYVESQGPSDTSGRPVRPKVSPHRPERRRLTRLALPLGRPGEMRTG